VQWDKSWDFTKGVPKDLKNGNNKAFYFDGATYFDGTARLELASSSDMFESGPFTVLLNGCRSTMPAVLSKSSGIIIGNLAE